MRARENEPKKATEKRQKQNPNRKSTAKAPSPGSVNYVCIIGNYGNMSAWGGGWFLTQKRRNETQNAYCSSLSTLVPQCCALSSVPLFASCCNSPLHLLNCACPPAAQKTKPGNLPRLCFVRLMYVTESTFGCYSKTGSRFIIHHWTLHVKGFSETGDIFF